MKCDYFRVKEDDDCDEPTLSDLIVQCASLGSMLSHIQDGTDGYLRDALNRMAPTPTPTPGMMCAGGSVHKFAHRGEEEGLVAGGPVPPASDGGPPALLSGDE